MISELVCRGVVSSPGDSGVVELLGVVRCSVVRSLGVVSGGDPGGEGRWWSLGCTVVRSSNPILCISLGLTSE